MPLIAEVSLPDEGRKSSWTRLTQLASYGKPEEVTVEQCITLAVRSLSGPAGVGGADQRLGVDKSISTTTAVRRRVAVREIGRQRHVAVIDVSRVAAAHL